MYLFDITIILLILYRCILIIQLHFLLLIYLKLYLILLTFIFEVAIRSISNKLNQSIAL